MSALVPRLVGITGGIATGKSTLAKAFKDLGVSVIDTDEISRECVAKNTPAWQAVVAHFGPEILNESQAINRQKLRDIIFSNPAERVWLEQLLHPLIRQSVLEKAAQLKAIYAVVLIPLLKHPKDYPLWKIILLDAPIATQLARLISRDGIEKSLAQAIIAAQPSFVERRAWADIVIDNTQTDTDLIAVAQKLDAQFRQR